MRFETSLFRMLGLWISTCRFFAYLYLALHGYRFWSYLYRILWEGRYKNTSLRAFGSIDELVRFIGGNAKWRQDSWRALFDAVSSPQRVQVVLSGEESVEYDLDCDDFMSFTVNAIDKSLKSGLMKEEHIERVFGLTVMWMKGWSPGGHNVTLLQYRDPDGIASWAYMDYGMPSQKCPDINAVANLVRTRYQGTKKYVGLAWSASEPNLRPWITHWQ